jgi:aryl-alcohol dehydrogenase-like predicted oxidoreductase
VVEAALEAGITFFDTADTYGAGEARFSGGVAGASRDG